MDLSGLTVSTMARIRPKNPIFRPALPCRRQYYRIDVCVNISLFFSFLSQMGAKWHYHYRSRQPRRETLSGLAENKPQRPVKYDYPLAQTIGQLPDFYRELILLRGQTYRATSSGSPSGSAKEQETSRK